LRHRGFVALKDNTFFRAITDQLEQDFKTTLQKVLEDEWTADNLPTLMNLIGEMRGFTRPMRLLDAEIARLAVAQQQTGKE
jgi:hypothetical protein